MDQLSACDGDVRGFSKTLSLCLAGSDGGGEGAADGGGGGEENRGCALLFVPVLIITVGKESPDVGEDEDDSEDREPC